MPLSLGPLSVAAWGFSLISLSDFCELPLTAGVAVFTSTALLASKFGSL